MGYTLFYSRKIPLRQVWRGGEVLVKELQERALYVNNLNNDSNANGNNNLNNNASFLRILQAWRHFIITLYEYFCSLENLKLAFKKAAKGKSLRLDVMLFSKNAEENLKELQMELPFYSYQPKPLKTFIIKDPKTSL